MKSIENRKILLVYNTCGIRRDNAQWYKECIASFLNQDFDGLHVVVSSCMNSVECFKELYSTFRDKISYCLYPDRYVVQTTFNKTVIEMVKKYGEFEGYLYVDSGVTFDNQINVLKKAYERLKTNKYAIVTIQTDTDAAFNDLSGGYVGDEMIEDSPVAFSLWAKERGGFAYETKFGDIQIRDEDFIVPPGASANLHANIFSNELFKEYNNKILADVFKAYCLESTFIWMAKSIEKDWVIVKDLQVRHVKALDVPCAGFNTHSSTTGNYWDNLFGNRTALEWMKDPEAIRAGLGYHNHPNVPLESRMQYSLDAFDENNKAKYPKDLAKIMKKYFFLNKEELDYDEVNFRLV
tara:strand:- start:264 stop:1316 length:1053 start_codon:yes stop_codon:yes gene_type:complete